MVAPFYLDINLKNKWTIWYHKQDEPNWNADSYIKIFEFSTVLEYARFKNSFIFLPQFLNGYYFFMVDDIPPQWEDEKNKMGGSYFIPLAKDITEQTVWSILEQAFLNRIFAKGVLHGISIVPKKYNALIKIWNNDKCLNNIDNLLLKNTSYKLEEIYYRGHSDNNHYGKNTLSG